MNKTISINIAGFVFNIEEEAYEKLSSYLESIKLNFKNEPDCEEIMADIEARIAELFQENLSDRKEVIVEKDVDQIVEIMGSPDDYVAEETADNFNGHESSTEKEEEAEYVEAEEVKSEDYRGRHNKKRLFRDEQGGTIGGVCAGLGWFFGLDPVLIRLAFVLLTILGGSGILVYIILWIVIPEAKTTAEILEMQGEPINLGSIKDHVKGMKDDVKDSSRKTGKKMKHAVNKGVRAGSRMARSLSKIVGVFLILGGIGGILILSILLFGDSGLVPLFGGEQVEDLTTLLDIIYPDGRSGLVYVSIIVVILIPIVSFIFVGTKLLFDIQGKFKRVSIITSIIWTIALCSLVLTGIELGMNFRNEVEIDFDVPVYVDSTETIFVDAVTDDVFSNYIEYQQVWNYTELIRVQNEEVYLGYPELRIVEAKDSGDFQVVLYKSSNGKYHKEAIRKAEDIRYEIKTSNNQIKLAPYFIISKEEKMRNQKVIVELRVPKGKKVKFGDNIDRILVKVRDNYYRHNESFSNTTWIAGRHGFECTECEDRRVYHEGINF
ncbi:PspC domain-containing protein [Paracrocinitomix mangrovi]|uniref:PspC domain-containing protein n=1 Tax=Paracrocinitomix mangrovi TaxID=2862509 RepID=UPI001C8EC507|nr:PspC domain-containing protein [Paracrocinitomix mangrovi]UKN03074.1 PspC domain-containing protein [Paracrocinitomix mangrovi]